MARSPTIKVQMKAHRNFDSICNNHPNLTLELDVKE
ncbi:hypothetical protein CCACVL1_09833 [Corchorus capsularis]|uniref:Uncharacterized protein n=1 Tax=Corchorus capsularis TaxID=210143 RepID=A0A1R3IU47_COCAP|nr:hypothetical protein CCACVL1_09833 [Corchorus capsularis]